MISKFLPISLILLFLAFFGPILADDQPTVLVNFPPNSTANNSSGPIPPPSADYDEDTLSILGEEQLNILETADMVIFGQDPANLTCDHFFNRSAYFVGKYPDWRESTTKARNERIDLIKKCGDPPTTIDNKTLAHQMKEILEYEGRMFECMDHQYAQNDMSVVAVVFIIGFILAVAALIIMSVLYIRK